MNRETYKGFAVSDLKERFEYDEASGKLYHKQGRFVGKEAGSVLTSNGGYRYICSGVGGKQKSLLAHRVIWGMVFGEFPKEGMVIDHIDGDPDNNRITNLRVVTHKENSRNRGRRKEKVNSRYVWTACTGVKFDKQESCYVALGDGEELCRTFCYDDAKYTRWNWEYDNEFTDRH